MKGDILQQRALFTHVRRFAPKDEVSKNAQLLIRAGFIHKEMAGVYAFLPLGWRVMERIMAIIREEMGALGAQEVFLTALQRREIWERTDRWRDDVVDVWFKTQLKNGAALGLGFTHEEVITAMMTQFVSSHKTLPFSAYQIQTKFRNETRAKSGIMRSREFLMKDLYSFSRTQAEHDAFYAAVRDAYRRIFTRVGIGVHTYLTFASGGTFSKYSHEFQTVCDAGEDTIYVDEARGIAVNEEVLSDEVLADLNLARENLVRRAAAEVGNIFSLGTRFSDAFGLRYRDDDGVEKAVIMGSYGIGPARVMGVVAEIYGTDDAMVWPVAIAPLQLHILSLGEDEVAQDVARACADAGVSVLIDDRDRRAGEKFAEADLIGCPLRVVVSPKTVADAEVEFLDRVSGAVPVRIARDAVAAHVRDVVRAATEVGDAATGSR